MIERRATAYLVYCGNLNAAWNNLGIHTLSTIFIQFRMVPINLALINLAQERHHFCVQHRGKQFRVECWVTKTLLESVPLGICSL